MEEKIYVINCSQELKAMGLNRVRKAVNVPKETVVSLDWSKVRVVSVVADEKTPFKAEETKILSIKPILIPKYAIVIQSFYGTNGMGHTSCIGSTEFKMFDETRTADKAMFQSRLNASVMKGDLLGQVLIIESKR